MKNISLRHFIWAFLIIATVLGGCGKKEAPQPILASSEKPQLVNLQYEQAGNVLKLSFGLKGNPKGLGYQIDRTEIDPYCQCTGFWRRYHDQHPLPDLANRKTNKIINLTTNNIEYVFRLRAVDLDGNLGSWTKSIRARGVSLSNK